MSTGVMVAFGLLYHIRVQVGVRLCQAMAANLGTVHTINSAASVVLGTLPLVLHQCTSLPGTALSMSTTRVGTD